MARSIEEVSSQTLALTEMFKSLVPGQQVMYTEIAKRTGVPMDVKGRARLRTAAKRAGRIYAVIRDVGLEMSSGENGASIVKSKVCKIDNAVKRGEKAGTMILHQHAGDLPPDERQMIMGICVMFASVRVLAGQHKREMRLALARKPRCVSMA